MASRSKADANGLLEPQFFVEHRIKTIFEEKPEVRQFSMHSVASEISKSRNKYVNGQLLGGLELQSDSEKSSKHGVVAEDLHAMLSTLQLRLNDTCILSPDDEVSETAGEFSRNASKGASRIHSPIVSRTPSGLLTPGDHSRDPSCSRGSSHSSSKKHSPGYLSPVSMSQASSRANSPTGKSTSLAAAAREIVKKGKKSSADGADSSSNVLVDSGHEENSETIAHSVRPKERDGNKRKPSQKKKKKSSETETEPAAEIKRSIIAGTIQLKLSSVHHFKGNSFNGKSPPT